MYLDECGRFLLNSNFTNLADEQGRVTTIRPLQEIGRWTNVVGIFLETVDITIALGVNPTVEFEETVCASCWDLRDMMPRKFRRSAMMMDYLDAVSQLVNSISCRISTLETLTSVEECPKRYLGHLAASIAYKFQNQQYASSTELRNQLKMAVEMYKIKGTYRVLQLACYLVGLHTEIYDLWTRDYVVFERQPPHRHSGIPIESGGFLIPAGLNLDSGYYMDETIPPGGSGVVSPWHFDSDLGFKSSHFDLIVYLDRLVTYQGYFNKLFVMGLYDLFADLIEDYTPINTVPHFYLQLICQTYENFLSYTIPNSQVKTCLMNAWDVSKLYFDDGKYADETNPVGGTGAPDPWHMDQSFQAMLSELTVVKIGNGNKGGTPLATDTALQNVVWTGTVNSFNMTDEKITFLITVPPGTILTDVSELGIFNVGTGELTIESFLPDLDKPSAVTLEITVEVLRKQP